MAGTAAARIQDGAIGKTIDQAVVSASPEVGIYRYATKNKTAAMAAAVGRYDPNLK